MLSLFAFVPVYPGADYLHPKIHFAPDYVAMKGSWHDIAGCVTHHGVHHVFQGEGWNHAVSSDLVHWSTAPHGPKAIHETYAGMDSTSDPCSGFITKDPATGSVCAGFRQCGSSKGVAGGAPWDVPLELRCALNNNLSVWNDESPEYLFNVSFWRAIPYDPARPWREADGQWYVLLSMDGCNETTRALPCHAGGMLSMWTSPALRGSKAAWKHVGSVFETNATVLKDGFLSKEFVTIDYIGKLEGDPKPGAAGGSGTRIFLNNVGGNGGGDGCCDGTTSYFVVEQRAGGKMTQVDPGQRMVDWGAFRLGPLPLPYSAHGVILPSAHASDLVLTGQATRVGGPADKMTSGVTIRSGDPGGTATILIGGGVIAPGHHIESVALRLRYIAGYCGQAPCPTNAANLSVVLLDTDDHELATLYRSPPLGNYSYDDFTTYSPPIAVNVSGLSVSNDALVRLAIMVDNNGRNLVIPIDDLDGGFHACIKWASTTATTTAAATPLELRGPAKPSLSMRSGTASRGLSMARTLGSEEADQVSVSGRRVLIGWTGPAPADMTALRDGGGSAQSLPRELSLGPDRSLLQRFVPELAQLRSAAPVAPADAGLQAEVVAMLPDRCGNALSRDEACALSVFGDGANATTVTLLPWLGLITVNGTSQGNTEVRAGPLPPACTTATCGFNGGWQLHAILDHSIVELIVNNATAFVVYVAPASVRAKQVSLHGSALLSEARDSTDDAQLEDGATLRVWQLKSANNLNP
jgi:hypothetical protein